VKVFKEKDIIARLSSNHQSLCILVKRDKKTLKVTLNEQGYSQQEITQEELDHLVGLANQTIKQANNGTKEDSL